MLSFLKTRVLIRRFKCITKLPFNDDPIKNRLNKRMLPPMFLSQTKRRGRHFIRLGSIICGPFNLPFMKNKTYLGELKGIFNCVIPNGNGNKDKTDSQKKRDEEIKKLQDLRQRNIDHIYDQESVWKAMKERDTLLRRDENEKEKDKEKSDNDERK